MAVEEGAWATDQRQDSFHSNIEQVPDDHPEYSAFRDRRAQRIRVDPIAKIAELESRLVLLESKTNALTGL